MPEGGFPTLPTTLPRPFRGERGGAGGEEEGEEGLEIEPEMDMEMEGGSPEETLARDRAAAGREAAAGSAAEAEKPNPMAEIQKTINSANHYAIVQWLPQVVSFDVSCFGLTSILTLPLFYWPLAAFVGYQAYNGWTNNKPMIPFPELTWSSLRPPGGSGATSGGGTPSGGGGSAGKSISEDDILPKSPLYIAWIAYVIVISALSVVWLGLITLWLIPTIDPMAGVKFIDLLGF